MIKEFKPKSISRRYMTLMELLISMVLAMVLLSSLAYIYQQVDWINTQGERLQKEEFKTRYVENRLNHVLTRTLSEYDTSKNFNFFTSSNLNGLLSNQNPSLVFMFDNGTNLSTEQAYHVLGRLFVDQQQRLCLAIMPSPDMWAENIMPPAAKEILLENVESLAFEFYVPPERNRDKVLNHMAKAKKKKSGAKSDPNKPDPSKDDQKKDDQKKKEEKKGTFFAKDKKAKEQPKKEQDKEEKKTDQPPTVEEGSETPQPDVIGAWQKTPWKREYNHLPPMIKIHITQKRPDIKEPIKMTFAFPLPRSGDMVVYE
jgi:hypothetical protein